MMALHAPPYPLLTGGRPNLVPHHRRVNANASKPRHVPAFCTVWNNHLHSYFSNLCDFPSDLPLILKYYQVGIIGLKRVQKDDDHVEGFIADFCRRSTRLTIDRQGVGAYRTHHQRSDEQDEISSPSTTASSTLCPSRMGSCKRNQEGMVVTSKISSVSASGDRDDGHCFPDGTENGDSTVVQDEPVHWTASIGFTNRSKRWTMCPSRVCCGSAVDRDKIVGQWKVLQLDASGTKLTVPTAVKESYDSIMDDADYFVCTLCPQQTYHAKHVPQGSDVVFDKHWHYTRRYKYPQDVLVFTDDDLITRIVWIMKRTEAGEGEGAGDVEDFVSKYDGEAEKAEAKLLGMMVKVMIDIRKGNCRVGGNTAAMNIEGRRSKSEPCSGGEDAAMHELNSRIF